MGLILNELLEIVKEQEEERRQQAMQLANRKKITTGSVIALAVAVGTAGVTHLVKKHRNKKEADKIDSGNSGYSKKGLDKVGSSKNGFDADIMYSDSFETDRSEDSTDYFETIQKLRDKSEKAMEALNEGKLNYALQDARQILEEALHIALDAERIEWRDTVSGNLKIAEEMDLLDTDQEFYEKLYEVKRLCNQAIHASVNDAPLTHDQAYFCIKTVEKLIDIVADIVCGDGFEPDWSEDLDDLDYFETFQKLRNKSEKAMEALAMEALNEDKLNYALQDARQILEVALHIAFDAACIEWEDTVSENLKFAEETDLLDTDQEFYEKLYEVKRLCNQAIHASVNDAPLTHDQAYFCIKTVEELIDMVEEQVF